MTLCDQVEKRWHTPHGQANVDHSGKIGGGGELDMQVRAWPTPKASDGEWASPRTSGRPIEKATHLQTIVGVWRDKPWSTPQDDDANNATRESGAFKSLTRDVQNWGTPRADEYKGTGPKGTASQLHRLGKGYLDAQVEEVADAGKNAESLNPDWEEILMGWEIGWTDPTKPCGIFPGFPMGQGHEQFDYEPPRTLPRKQMTGRTARIKMVGNGIVPQCAFAAYVRLLSELLDSPEVSA